ncbi:hypothetical protein IQ06DRAFT_289751 [Phaeosphaeriaceae sp. SRC1lsM3a]|nr:hypothetical protein IQ06DRAFT_289751 [Stagonospora sp. SRC1lsM3a]
MRTQKRSFAAPRYFVIYPTVPPADYPSAQRTLTHRLHASSPFVHTTCRVANSVRTMFRTGLNVAEIFPSVEIDPTPLEPRRIDRFISCRYVLP